MVQLPALPRSIRHGFWVGLEGWFPGGIQAGRSGLRVGGFRAFRVFEVLRVLGLGLGALGLLGFLRF